MSKHYSYSQLNSYSRCGKAYWLERIAHAPQRPAVYFTAGSALHKAIEELNKDYVKEITA